MTALKETQSRNSNDTEGFCMNLCKGDDYGWAHLCQPCENQLEYENCDDCFQDSLHCDCFCKDCKEKHSSNETSSEDSNETSSEDSNETSSEDSNETSSEDPTTTDTVDSNDDGLMKKIDNIKSKLEIPRKRHRGRQNASKQTMSHREGKNGKSVGIITPPMNQMGN